MLDSFSTFDAALVSRFELTKEQLLLIKNTALYQRMKERYSEEKIEMLTEVTNNVFDVFERAVINEIM